MSADDQPVGLGPLSDAIPVSDGEAIDRLRRWGGEKLVDQMMGIFLSQAPDRIAAARAGLEAGSARDVERAVHALRSSSAQLGVSRVHALCEVIEPRAAAGDLTGMDDLLASLENEMQRYVAHTRTGTDTP